MMVFETGGLEGLEYAGRRLFLTLLERIMVMTMVFIVDLLFVVF